MLMAIGKKTFKLPTLNGQLVWWATVLDKDNIIYSSGSVVSEILPNGGLFPGSLAQSTAGLQGTYSASEINGRPALVNVRNYRVGTNTDLAFLYDKSRPYGVFCLFNAGASGPLLASFYGGFNSGYYLGLNANGSIGKAIRNGNGSASTDLFNQGGTAGEYTFGNNAWISDMFYGYQVTGNDAELSLNGNTPSVVVANCNTSSYSPTSSEFGLTFGNRNAITYTYKYAECAIIDFSGLTRAQMDADKAAMEAWRIANYGTL